MTPEERSQALADLETHLQKVGFQVIVWLGDSWVPRAHRVTPRLYLPGSDSAAPGVTGLEWAPYPPKGPAWMRGQEDRPRIRFKAPLREWRIEDEILTTVNNTVAKWLAGQAPKGAVLNAATFPLKEERDSGRSYYLEKAVVQIIPRLGSPWSNFGI